MKHAGDNLSDHSTIIVDLQITMSYTVSDNIRAHVSKPLWCDASMTDLMNYYFHLVDNLTNIDTPLSAIRCLRSTR